MDSQLAEAEALKLRQTARDHMRAARRHRRRARELMQQLDGLIAACEKRGIQININRQDPGGPSGSQGERAG